MDQAHLTDLPCLMMATQSSSMEIRKASRASGTSEAKGGKTAKGTVT